MADVHVIPLGKALCIGVCHILYQRWLSTLAKGRIIMFPWFAVTGGAGAG